MAEPLAWNWTLFQRTSPAAKPHVHACPRCHEDVGPCDLDCSAHLEHGPSHGSAVLCDACGESPDGETFVCEVCLLTFHWLEGAADEYPRACDTCWAAFHEETPHG